MTIVANLTLKDNTQIWIQPKYIVSVKQHDRNHVIMSMANGKDYIVANTIDYLISIISGK